MHPRRGSEVPPPQTISGLPVWSGGRRSPSFVHYTNANDIRGQCQLLDGSSLSSQRERLTTVSDFADVVIYQFCPNNKHCTVNVFFFFILFIDQFFTDTLSGFFIHSFVWLQQLFTDNWITD